MDTPTAVPVSSSTAPRKNRVLLLTIVIVIVLAVVAWFAVPKIIAMRDARRAAAQAQYRADVHAQMEADAAANPVTVTDSQKAAIQKQMTTVAAGTAASAPTDDQKAQIRAQMQAANSANN